MEKGKIPTGNIVNETADFSKFHLNTATAETRNFIFRMTFGGKGKTPMAFRF